MMQSFILIAVVTVLWAVVGYGIAFGEATQFFGAAIITGVDQPLGWVGGDAAQVVSQSAGSVVAWMPAMIGSYILLKITDLIVGPRADPGHEQQGLDLSMRGEEGYSFES
jgi:Amt family ammonium transporter